MVIEKKYEMRDNFIFRCFYVLSQMGLNFAFARSFSRKKKTQNFSGEKGKVLLANLMFLGQAQNIFSSPCLFFMLCKKKNIIFNGLFVCFARVRE